MIIEEIKDKKIYSSFFSNQKHNQFLQSWEWGEFQEKSGNKIFRFGLEEKGDIIFVISLIKKTLPFGNGYFYSPRINFNILSEEQKKYLFSEITKIAKQEKIIFLRFEPEQELNKFKIQKTIDVQPSKTIILNLEKTEEELLKNMRQKTRYNIRLAEKKGVEIKEANLERFDEFWNIMNETKTRDGFRTHTKEYYKKMLSINFIKLYLAEYENKIIAGNIVSCYGDTTVYIHGASSNEYRNVMAPYLLQWHTIKKAREQGCKYYDFYGIDEKKWPGVTRFKKGFSGKENSYPGTFDLVFNKYIYNIYLFARKIRRSI